MGLADDYSNESQIVESLGGPKVCQDQKRKGAHTSPWNGNLRKPEQNL